MSDRLMHAPTVIEVNNLQELRLVELVEKDLCYLLNVAEVKILTWDDVDRLQEENANKERLHEELVYSEDRKEIRTDCS